MWWRRGYPSIWRPWSSEEPRLKWPATKTKQCHCRLLLLGDHRKQHAERDYKHNIAHWKTGCNSFRLWIVSNFGEKWQSGRLHASREIRRILGTPRATRILPVSSVCVFRRLSFFTEIRDYLHFIGWLCSRWLRGNLMRMGGELWFNDRLND